MLFYKKEDTDKETEDVDSFFELTNNALDNNFSINNWINIYPTAFATTIQYQVLQKLHQRGGALWLNVNGDICYRLSIDEDIHATTCEKASRVISSFLGLDIVIEKKYRTRKTKHISQNPIKKILENIQQNAIVYLSIHDLLLVASESFHPSMKSEFYLSLNGLIYRNTFKPSCFMYDHLPVQSHYPSIILQYLYHLTHYNQERFYFLLDWLASCYQSLLPSINTHLVLIGEKQSGVDLLFNNIIKPLFGPSNCISVTYDLLQVNNLSNALNNKLFYNLDSIGTQVNHDLKSKRILNSIINERTINPIINRTTSKEAYIPGQLLITEREVTIPYLNQEKNNFILFKVPDNIETIFLPENMILNNIKSDSKELYLSTSFSVDLSNFSYILKKRIINQASLDNFVKTMKDDRYLLQQTVDDKINAFHIAIIKMDKIYFDKIKNIDPDLYQDIMQDFEVKRIKQPNLLPCYEYIYGKDDYLTSRTLMSALRKIDHTFYSTKTMGIGAGGIKYFKC